MLVSLYEYVVVGHVVCMSACMLERYLHVRIGLFVLLRVCGQNWFSGSAAQEFCIKISASQNVEMLETLYFLKKGCLYLSCKWSK